MNETPSVDELLNVGSVIEDPKPDPNQVVTDRIFTAANVVTFIRLCLVPVYYILLLKGQSITASIIFAVAAFTDCVDGQLARRTNTVSKLGKIMDPAVDRILMIMGVLGVYVVGRLPLWVILIVIARDLYLLGAGAYMLDKYHERVDVIFPGKVATTFLFIGFFGLMMNFPVLPGLGLCDFSWLPGFNSQPSSWGIWFVYAGLIINIFTTYYYVTTAFSKTHDARVQRKMEKRK